MVDVVRQAKKVAEKEDQDTPSRVRHEATQYESSSYVD